MIICCQLSVINQYYYNSVYYYLNVQEVKTIRHSVLSSYKTTCLQLRHFEHGLQYMYACMQAAKRRPVLCSKYCYHCCF